MLPVGGQEEEAVFHAQRLKNPRLDKLLVRLIGNHLDDAAERGDAQVAVLPLGAGIEIERLLRSERHDFGQSSRFAGDGFIERLGRHAEHARRVGQQIAQRNRARGAAQYSLGIAVLSPSRLSITHMFLKSGKYFSTASPS